MLSCILLCPCQRCFCYDLQALFMEWCRPLIFYNACWCCTQNDDTNEGWRRDGWWDTTNDVWQKGRCQALYNRTCSIPGLWKKRDLRTQLSGLVDNTDAAYRARISYDYLRVTADGRWFERDGECIDEVQQGCFNNGTCVAPNTVRPSPLLHWWDNNARC